MVRMSVTQGVLDALIQTKNTTNTQLSHSKDMIHIAKRLDTVHNVRCMERPFLSGAGDIC